MLVMVNQSSSIGVFEAFELNGVLLRTLAGSPPFTTDRTRRRAD